MLICHPFVYKLVQPFGECSLAGASNHNLHMVKVQREDSQNRNYKWLLITGQMFVLTFNKRSSN